MAITVATWNMQGNVNYSGLPKVFTDFKPQIVCLQETGNLKHQLRNQVQFPSVGAKRGIRGALRIGKNDHMCIYWPNPIEARLGVAIISTLNLKDFGVLTASAAPKTTPKCPRNLPWVEVEYPGTRNVIRLYSVHAPSEGSAKASNWNNAQLAKVSRLSRRWAVIGDFNADPRSDNIERPSKGNWVHGGRATQQKLGLLDYMITNANAKHFSPQFGVSANADHFPQGFILA